jgi:hypothetical protein
MLVLAFIRFSEVSLWFLATFHLLYQKYRQVQLIQRVDYPGQGSLVGKLPSKFVTGAPSSAAAWRIDIPSNRSLQLPGMDPLTRIW